MFEDISNNPNRSKVQPIARRHRKDVFSYKKRIQLVVYNLAIVTNFQLVDYYKCK